MAVSAAADLVRRLVAGLLLTVCALLPPFAVAGDPSPVELVRDTTSRIHDGDQGEQGGHRPR